MFILKKIVPMFLIVVFLSSCVTSTNVMFRTDKDGATVKIDGQVVGTTPVRVGLSNAVWEDPDILVQQTGYKDYYGKLRKEIKPVNLIFGLLLWFPSLLWCYGPDSDQYIALMSDNN